MRLTEEFVKLLTAIASTRAPADQQRRLAEFETLDELLAEAVHEGCLEPSANSAGAFTLTSTGHELLARISRQLVPVDQLTTGQPARIAYLSTTNYPRFQKLSALGLSPGVPVILQQKFPSFVIQCEETQIALEKDIARDIFVWIDQPTKS